MRLNRNSSSSSPHAFRWQFADCLRRYPSLPGQRARCAASPQPPKARSPSKGDAVRALIYSAEMFVAEDVLSGRLASASAHGALLETPDGDGLGDLLRAALRLFLLSNKVSLDTALNEKTPCCTSSRTPPPCLPTSVQPEDLWERIKQDKQRGNRRGKHRNAANAWIIAAQRM